MSILHNRLALAVDETLGNVFWLYADQIAGVHDQGPAGFADD